MLVSAYIVERGLILDPCQVDAKTNEIKALPELIEKLMVRVKSFDRLLDPRLLKEVGDLGLSTRQN